MFLCMFGFDQPPFSILISACFCWVFSLVLDCVRTVTLVAGYFAWFFGFLILDCVVGG